MIGEYKRRPPRPGESEPARGDPKSVPAPRDASVRVPEPPKQHHALSRVLCFAC